MGIGYYYYVQNNHACTKCLIINKKLDQFVSNIARQKRRKRGERRIMTQTENIKMGKEE